MRDVDNCELLELYGFLGKKWTVPLLYNIDHVPVSFNRLNNITQHKINPTLLSKTLAEAVKLRIIKKDTIKNKICYSITSEGEILKKLLGKLTTWAIHHNYNIPNECKKGKSSCDVRFLRVLYR
jgi:DNA-binding HxlR family transcriptional regulator